MKSFLLLLPFTLLLESSLQALTLPVAGQTLAASPEFAPAEAAAFDFEGIVALSNCSGSLVRFDDSQDTDPAMVLSNGHCTGLIDPGKVLVKQKATRSFDILNSKAQKIGSIRATQLLYATMTKTDMSLYQVKETYEEIRSRFNIAPLTFAREAPLVGDAIEILSGYWKRGYACQIESVIPTLKEGNWSFAESLRYSRPGCDTIGGTSGSPVIAAGTKTVVAVNNTGNESGGKCGVNNPCEVDAAGNITFKKGYSYAQQTYWLYTCRDEQGLLDLTLPDCQLPR